MKNLLLLLSLNCTTFLLVAAPSHGPQYVTAETKSVVLDMIEAHGGLAAWQSMRTLSFTNIFFNPLAPAGNDPWWLSHEVFDQATRRAYHDWPLDKAQLTYDGNEVWTVNWKKANHPKFMATFFYYFLNLPWLTQDDNVLLSEPGEATLPGDDTVYITVDMAFRESTSPGRTARDAYTLYIHPESYILKAYTYTVGYGAMLDLMGIPPGQSTMGPVLRIHDSFTRVDGLLFPDRFHTGPMDGSTIWGHHIVTNYTLNTPFDESRMRKPSTAVVDASSDQRQAR